MDGPLWSFGVYWIQEILVLQGMLTTTGSSLRYDHDIVYMHILYSILCNAMYSFSPQQQSSNGNLCEQLDLSLMT